MLQFLYRNIYSYILSIMDHVLVLGVVVCVEYDRILTSHAGG